MNSMRGLFAILFLLIAVNMFMGGFAESEYDTPFTEGFCHNETSIANCLDTQQNGTTCFWCKSGAVPSSCYTAAEAKRLPSPVFVCINSTATTTTSSTGATVN